MSKHYSHFPLSPPSSTGLTIWGVEEQTQRPLLILLPSSGVQDAAGIGKSRSPSMTGCVSMAGGIPLVQPGSDASLNGVFEVVLG